MKYIILSIILIPMVLGARLVHANGFGMTVDKVVGNYTANVDYDAVGGIYTGDTVQFAFQLFNKDRSQLVDFTDVWVTVTPKGLSSDAYTPPIFDGGIYATKSAFSPSGMTFTFLAGGAYDLTLRFDNGDKTLAEATFPLTVEGGQVKTLGTNNTLRNSIASGVLGLLVGLSLMRFFRRKT